MLARKYVKQTLVRRGDKSAKGSGISGLVKPQSQDVSTTERFVEAASVQGKYKGGVASDENFQQ
jgi:hypothetical protein